MSLPRATFILLAYRQEPFVEGAVRSALEQDYDNLEIILSDDNSPDATFAIMERLASEYDGSHRIILNRTRGGAGTLAHLHDAFGKSTGDLIVVGAGDDLSYPRRVSRLVRHWADTGADAMFSAMHRIDSSGARLSDEPFRPRADYDPSRYFVHGRARQIAGASSAYSRALLESVAIPSRPIFAEDFYLSLMVALQGGDVAVLDEPLVAYRVHDGALTAAGEDLLGVEGFERKSAQSAEMVCGILRLFEDMLRTGDGAGSSHRAHAAVDRDALRREIAFLDYRARWMDLPVWARLASAVRFSEPDQQRWLLPRLFGVRALAAAKRL